MRSGTVKWFNARKGYGVIHPTDGGFNLYVDIAAVSRAGLAELKAGQTVHFEAVADERTGEFFAENLSIPPSAPAAIAPLLSPLAGRKASWFGALSRAMTMRLSEPASPVEVAVSRDGGRLERKVF
jgi:CspA family cold shock protein